jgi:hypothetical protein
MNYLTSAALGLITFSLVGCVAQSKLTYSSLPEEGSEGVGFPFVVPRTVVKVDSVPDKNGGTDKVSFATVPVAYAADGKTTLPRFLAVDSSSSAFSLTPTTISTVTYADELIISAIGTQVTDNRKDAIDAVIGIAALAGAFAAVDCTKAPLKPFVLDPVASTPVVGPAPNNNCWGYSTKPTDANPIGMHPYPVKDLAAVGQSVAWFPIPACRSYHVTVFRCNDKLCSKEGDVASTTVLSVSDGTQYRRVPLPGKGKILLHSDFCQADITNEAVGTSDWGLLNQAISDVKAAKKK